ncbi:MAG: glycoside hydrolase family 3 C-terminal domain-containing protein, partial [Bacillota bacterium]
RRFVDVKVDERTMHEMYLYPLYKVIQAAKPWMIMSSYNRLNGDYASESSYLLQDVLRKQWGYDGVVISDWGAVQDKVKSIKNGMNIDMPGPSAYEEDVKAAIKSGTLKESELDQSLAPLFKLHDKVKTIDKLPTIDLNHHHKLAQTVAKEAIVLLENDGILPIKNTNQTIGIIGEFAKKPRINGGGSATVKPYKQEIPFEAIRAVFKNINYAEGYQENDTSKNSIDEAKKVAKRSDTVFFFTGTTDVIETEGKDRDHLNLPTSHIKVFEAIRQVNKNIIVILSNGSALDLTTLIPYSRAILETWFLGGAAGNAIVDIITGQTNPSGRLQETFPLKLEHTPHYKTFPPLETVDYNQDLIMNGYRYYDTHNYDVLYPFGYGLSYADISYKNITWKPNKNALITADVTLQNTSDIGAFETIQIYVSTSIPYLVKPQKELKAFKKVWLDANQTKTVSIDIPLNACETYDVNHHGFVVYNGSYTLSLGRHSRDIMSTHTVELTNQIAYQPKITFNHPVKFLELYYPSWFSYIEENYRQLWWHEKEEPIWRVLDRYKRHNSIDDDAMDTLIKRIQTDINK